jgi:integral membrane sensor domain MASE1
MRFAIQTLSARGRSAPDAMAPPLMGPMESRLALRLLLVCVGYYAGASIGLGLKFGWLTPSVLWTPNAILTATLLLTAPRRWWLYLLAALPAHMAIELTTTLPRSLVLALFLTNCAEAVLAAGLARWVSDAPTRFDTFRRVAAFVLTAGVAAPFLSSFPDAAFVHLLRGEPYWSVFSTRFPSNVLAELLVVPTIVTAVRAVLERRGPPPRRLLEIALLGGGLLAVSVVAFGHAGPLTSRNPWSLHTSYALLLPFFLWAAVRFGPGGLSACLLTTTLFAIRTGTLEVAAFSIAQWGDGVLALQIFLIVVSIPLLCLAAVIEEERQTSEALQERLAFEGLLSRLSSAFVRLPSPEMDRAFETWLTNVGVHLRSGALALLELAPSGEALTLRFGSPPPRAAVPRALASRDFPWIAARLSEERPVVFGSLDELPVEAARERTMLAENGVGSGAILPLEAGGRVLGGLAYLASGPRTRWPAQLEPRLQLVGEVFANALARRGTEGALRASEEMKSAVLASLRSGVAVLDRDGTVIAVNEGWSEHAAEAGPTSASRAGLGDNYLALWRQAQSAGNVQAAHAAAGIEGVLQGRRERFAFEYTWYDAMPERWFALSAVPLHRSGSGAVISNTEITDWKRAELEAQRSRQELAHFTRVSTMGALA